jgi:hypothetical protein
MRHVLLTARSPSGIGVTVNGHFLAIDPRRRVPAAVRAAPSIWHDVISVFAAVAPVDWLVFSRNMTLLK